MKTPPSLVFKTKIFETHTLHPAKAQSANQTSKETTPTLTHEAQKFHRSDDLMLLHLLQKILLAGDKQKDSTCEGPPLRMKRKSRDELLSSV